MELLPRLIGTLLDSLITLPLKNQSFILPDYKM
jgi:hypothetical protein